jgi:hypothetical protein
VGLTVCATANTKIEREVKMSVTEFRPGSVIIAGGGSCPMGKFDPVIIAILSRFDVSSYKSLIFSQEWSKEGAAPYSPLWSFDNKPERLCKDMILVCEAMAEKEEFDFIVIDRRGISDHIEAYTESDVSKLHRLAKKMNVMILFIPNIKDKDLGLNLFTDKFRCQVGVDWGTSAPNELCDAEEIERSVKLLRKLRAPTREERLKTFKDLTEEEK